MDRINKINEFLKVRQNEKKEIKYGGEVTCLELGE